MNKPRKTLKKSVLCSALISALGTSNAAIINVDSGCSLIDAISSANTDASVGTCTAGSGADTIQIVGENRTINIIGPLVTPLGPVRGIGSSVNALPSISSTMTIEGNGLTLDASNATDPVRIFTIETDGDLTLKDTTVTGANSGQSQGSGLASYGGRVTLDNTTFANNQFGVTLQGGSGHVINNSVIRHNVATNAPDIYRGLVSGYGLAAGLGLSFTSATITNSAVIENAVIENQSILLRGGGSYYLPAGGIGIFQAEVDIADTTISSNQSFYGAGMVISASNITRRGELINNDITITNSTITNNEAIYIGGIFIQDEYATLTMQGSIVSGNKERYSEFAPNIFNDDQATINLDANNIIGDYGSTGSVGLTLGASDASFINNTDDNLYPLTLTQGQLLHPLKVNSAAIDGNNLTCFGSLADQSTKPRGIDGDDNGSFICDIGSSEHSLPIVVDNAPCTLENAIISANNDASVGGCQPGSFHDIIELPNNSTVSLSTAADYYGDFYFGLPSIDTAITIEGNKTTIERDSGATDAFDLLLINADGQLNLFGTRVTGANGDLGAVTTISGNVNVVNSTIINNQAMGLLDISSINSAVINSTISNNSPTSPSSFGSYYASGLSSIRSNGFELSNSTIANNNSLFIGGANTSQSRLTRIRNSTISNNAGVVGGLASFDDKYFQISGLTATNNSGAFAGGIYASSPNIGDLKMANSIVSGNILIPPTPASTLNSPFGLANDQQLGGSGSVPSEIFSYGYSLILSNYNILGQNGDSGTVGVTLTGDTIIPDDSSDEVIEDTLADNGGTTLTHLPISGGDAVDNGGVFCGLNEDQLGRIRPWDGDNDGNDACDVGAVELGSVTSSDLIFKDGFDAQIILRRTPNN